MKLSLRTECPQWLLLAAMFAAALASWSGTPTRVPVHWTLSGAVDRYGGRFEALLLLPLVALGVYVLLLFLPRIDPARTSYEPFAQAYATIRLAILTLLAAFYVVLHLMLRGHWVDPLRFLPLLLGLFLIAVGDAIGNLRPNWFVGMRTPWALSSRKSWDASNRLGRRVLIASGLLLLVAGWIGKLWALIASWVFLLLGVLAVMVVSYRVWRDDPDKVPPARS